MIQNISVSPLTLLHTGLLQQIKYKKKYGITNKTPDTESVERKRC